MEKYLFTDGTNEIREVQSKEELQALIQSTAEPGKIRIWIFNTSEWISLADFNKRSYKIIAPVANPVPAIEIKEQRKPVSKPGIPAMLKKIVAGFIGAGAIFLVYNFTKLTWRKASPLTISAERPSNTPAADPDSLIATIELLRGQKLDKVTRTNLRIRNNWPDLLQLRLTGERDTSREGSRFYNMELSVDNSTGYNIDNAEVKLEVWKNNETRFTDTFLFANIGYSAPARRKIEGMHKGDSISVSFSSIRSKVFNFCYSSDKRSNYGNYNDRWFCKE